jgi:glutaredoxin
MIKLISKPNCPFCDRAKDLLTLKHVPFTEVIIDIGQTLAEGKAYISLSEFKDENPGVKTVPYITDDKKNIGGFKELKLYLESNYTQGVELGPSL